MTLLFIFVRNIVVKMGLVQPPFWEVWKVSFGLKKGEYIGSTDHDSSELMAFIQVGLNTRLFCTREKDSLPHKVPVELMDQNAPFMRDCEVSRFYFYIGYFIIVYRITVDNI